MKLAARLLLASCVTLLCSIAGVAIAIALAPSETSIDEGWRLAWIGLGGGVVIGIAIVGATWRRSRTS